MPPKVPGAAGSRPPNVATPEESAIPEGGQTASGSPVNAARMRASERPMQGYAGDGKSSGSAEAISANPSFNSAKGTPASKPEGTPAEAGMPRTGSSENAGLKRTMSRGKMRATFQGLQKVVLFGAPAKVEAANKCAETMCPGVMFQSRLVKDSEAGKDNLRVLVSRSSVSDSHTHVCWSWPKFLTRLDMMERLLAEGFNYYSNSRLPLNLKNPFWDNEANMLGEGTAYLASLGNMLAAEPTVKIISTTGLSLGTISLKIEPLDEKGDEGPWEDDREDLDPFVEEPEELIGEDINFMIKVEALTLEQPQCFQSLSVRYKINAKGKAWQEWAPWTRERNPDGQGRISYDIKDKRTTKVDAAFCEFLKTGGIILQLQGKLADPMGGWDPPVSERSLTTAAAPCKTPESQ